MYRKSHRFCVLNKCRESARVRVVSVVNWRSSYPFDVRSSLHIIVDKILLNYRLCLGWIPRIFRSFFCAKIFCFWPIHMKAHIEKCKKMLKFFRLFMNIHDFFDFLGVFRIKLICTVSYSHVLTIIRFPVKFHIGL